MSTGLDNDEKIILTNLLRKPSKLNQKTIKVLSKIVRTKAAEAPKPKRFILLPANQLLATSNTGNSDVAKFLKSLSRNVSVRGGMKLASHVSRVKQPAININVVDSIHENGAKLVTIDEEQMADFRFSYPGLRIIPEKFYRLAFRYEPNKSRFNRSGIRATNKITTAIQILDKNGVALQDIYVVAFTDFASRTGDSGTTDASGIVKLKLNTNKIDRIYVYPDHTYWGFFKKNFTIGNSFKITLKAIDLAFDDCLRHFYPTRTWSPVPGKVRIGILDTGFKSGQHKDLKIFSGVNMVLGENPADYADTDGHGTHVAGIIGAHGDLPGVAQGVELCIYRVFPTGGEASNYDIMKAIDQAKTDGCDFVNMSLGEEDLDEGIISSIKDAYNEGTICFAANGNEDRSPVNFPASYSLCIAVSAMGRKGCFPSQTVQSGIVHSPYGKDKANFIADFSNIGTETDLTAPGVGIISTYPEHKYAVMDGTSMACPAAVGMAARLLAGEPQLLAMPRNQARADAIQKYLATKIKTLGFGTNFEGKGMLFP